MTNSYKYDVDDKTAAAVDEFRDRKRSRSREEWDARVAEAKAIHDRVISHFFGLLKSVPPHHTLVKKCVFGGGLTYWEVTTCIGCGEKWVVEKHDTFD